MHVNSISRMEWFLDRFVSKTEKSKIKVLDVGSYSVNGSYKELFAEEKYEYVGLDMLPGPNVDIALSNPYNWSELETDSYDVVISGQTFEHVEFFWITMAEMARVLKKDGLLCIIVPNNFFEHRCPVDCYRFFTDGMVALARYVSLDILHAHTNCAPAADSKNWYSLNEADSLLIAQKTYEGNTKIVNLDTYVCVPPEKEIVNTGLLPFKPKYAKLLHLLKRLENKIAYL
jgi:SAM-dependent methyltransferase